MKDVLNDNPTESLELFSGEDFEFIAFSSFEIRVEGFGFYIEGKVSFQQPIGMNVFD